VSDERPNIVLVTVDSLRADHCGFMGYERDTTPSLDEMAEDGLVFKRAIAPAPFTEESIPAIFTGDYPLPKDRDNELGARIREYISKHRSVVQTLSDAGYTTIGFSPNPHASRQFGLDQGFDQFHDFIGESRTGDVLSTMASRALSGDFIECFRLGTNMAGLNVPGFGNQSIPMRAYYDQILRELDDISEPFFLWVFPLEVHSPYRPERRYRTMSLPRMLYLNLIRSVFIDRDPSNAETSRLLELYDGAVKSLDSTLRDLRSDLSEYDPTYIVTSDHGEAFGEHGDFGHNDELYWENVHVPLLVSAVDTQTQVSNPFSLRKVPDLIEWIALSSKEELKPTSDNTVHSRVEGDKIGAYSASEGIIASGDGFERLDQHGSSDMTELIEALGHFLESRSEKSRITANAQNFPRSTHE